MSMRQTIGLGLAVLLAGPAVALGPAASAVAATAAAAGPARPGAAVASACGVDLGALDHPPLALRLHGVRRFYREGGGWSPIRLTLRNRLGRRCAGVRPVLVFGLRAGALRHGDVRLQWRRGGGAGGSGGGWRTVPLRAEAAVSSPEAVLAGQTGPAAGLAVAAGSRAAVPMRMRIGRGAPLGQWLTMAVGFEPVVLDGQPVPLPVGISNPSLFRVVHGQGHSRGHSRANSRSHARTYAHAGFRGGRSQLAETGAGTGAGTLAAGSAAAVLLLGCGAGLLVLRRWAARADRA